MTVSILICALFVLLCLSAFFSGSETGIYRVNRFLLRLGVEQRRPFFAKLSHAIEDGQGLILSLLLGNNLVNYLITSLMTWGLLRLIEDERRVELLSTAIVTPILFLIGEIIPKTIFFYQANRLTFFFAPAIWFFWKLFSASGAVRLMRMIADFFSRVLRLSVDSAAAIDVTQRGQVRQIIQETRDEGLLSTFQKNMMHQLINIPEVPVGALLIPLAKVDMLELNSDRHTLLRLIERSHRRRIPVYEKDRNKILGYIDVFQVLGSRIEFDNLRSFIEPIYRLNVSISALDAISIMRHGKHRIALVVSDTSMDIAGSKRAMGIITLNDLVEELTGELSGIEPHKP